MLENIFLLQRNYLQISYDYLFGSSLFGKLSETFYKYETNMMYNTQYKKTSQFQQTSLYNVRLVQSPTTIKSEVTPANFVEILSMCGGFVTLITKLTGWILRNYQRFQFRKSSIKKLYFYNRTKHKDNEQKPGTFSFKQASMIMNMNLPAKTPSA